MTGLAPETIIRLTDGAVEMLDQTRLPGEEATLVCRAWVEVVDAMIASIRRTGSGSSVASDARIAPTALPPPGSSAGRVFTGSIATSGLSGKALCSTRSRRNAAPHSARATSLSVPPVALASALRRGSA